MSEDYRATIRLQGMISGIAFLCMFILFVILRLIVARADQIIDAGPAKGRSWKTSCAAASIWPAWGRWWPRFPMRSKIPLGIIRSTAEMLQKRLGHDSPGNEQLSKVIVEETARLDSIVREFLDFARPREMRVQPVAVREVVEEVTEVRCPGTGKTPNMICQLRGRRWSAESIPADRELLYRAILNVLLNGIQAMGKDGRLMVAVTKPGQARGV